MVGYRPKTRLAALGWVIEECGEVLQCIGKIMRFGKENYHPTDLNKVTNSERLEAEFSDLKAALRHLPKVIINGKQG